MSYRVNWRRYIFMCFVVSGSPSVKALYIAIGFGVSYGFDLLLKALC